MSYKQLISLGLLATILTAPVANAATLTAQVPTAKVALPAPMTDAELDEVTGQEQHFTPGGKGPISAGAGIGGIGRTVAKAATQEAVSGIGTAIGAAALTQYTTEGKVDLKTVGAGAVGGGVTGGMVGRIDAAVDAAGVGKVGKAIKFVNGILSGAAGAGSSLIINGGIPKKP